MTVVLPELLTCLDIPHADCLVLSAAGDETLAVGEEDHTPYGRGVAFILAQLFSSRDVSDAHGMVFSDAAGDDALTVLRKRGTKVGANIDPL